MKAELQINCSVFGETEINVVTDITEGTECERKSNSAITVYFPCHEEALWDIAKRYHISSASIRSANRMEDDTLTMGTMLVIPISR